jgi:hypothetical protein
MINSSPITPPPELRKLWAQQAQRLTPHDITGWLDYVATQAAQWGANQEREACCEEMKSLPKPFGIPFGKIAANALYAARRPKPLTLPLTLKDQALALLEIQHGLNVEDLDLLRRALETIHD